MDMPQPRAALSSFDAEQRSHPDGRTARPEPVPGIPLVQAPGCVGLQPAQEFATTAGQFPRVITHANVPLGVKVTKGAEIGSMLGYRLYPSYCF